MGRSFVDCIHISLSAGRGGDGAISFLRERNRPKGGPDGGDGGAGGNVVVQTSTNLNTLSHLSGLSDLSAENGAPGAGARRSGACGADRIILVPPGTAFFKQGSAEPVLDTASTSSAVLLHGGRGGKGNHHFRGPRRQLPRFAQEGEAGEEGFFRLELRLIADIGLVGWPNAGKSSLQNLLTNAHPKTAAYPFTTTVPNLGVLRVFDQDVVIADIPGIISGAASGSGLGLRFLSHISHAAALLFVVDLAAEDFAAAIPALRTELGHYDKEYGTCLLEKPWAILANKIDLEGAQEHLERLKKQFSGISILAASSIDPSYTVRLQKLLLELKQLV